MIQWWVLLLFCIASTLPACSEFLLRTQDKHVIVARSMDFNDIHPMLSEIHLHPIGECKTSKAPFGFKGLEWSNKYGFIAIQVYHLDCVVDGMNEQGLSFAYLWMDGADYSNITDGDSPNLLAFEDVGGWILGNFKTIDEVIENLSQVSIWGYPIEPLAITPPLHIALHDATGKSLVIEFIGGKILVYNNSLGVLTNDPPFDQQLEQMEDSKATRFAQIASFQNEIQAPQNSNDGVLLAFHLLNRLDIPFGTLKESRGNNSKFHFTLWSLVKDLSNKVFYFRTYDQPNIRQINFSHIDFSETLHTSFVIYPSFKNVKSKDITSKLTKKK